MSKENNALAETIVKPDRPGGFLDFLPADYLARESMLKKIEEVYRSFGFDPIETPRIEFLKTLAGETSDTGKNIFHIKSSQDDEPLAMPFDHTVPFARLLAANPYDTKKRTGIRLPWRRMVVGPVFRSDTPQSGRYRQFYQFDVDIAGTSSMMADAEIVALMYLTMKKLGVENFKIRINNRKILNGLSLLAGIHRRGKISADDITKEMMRILDKLDKIGICRVLTELQAAPENPVIPAPQLSSEAIEKIRSFLSLKGDNSQKIAQCQELFREINIAQEGLEELSLILNYLYSMNIPKKYVDIDFSIARGLDYYTGPVFETILLDAPEFGSVFSGGRYNDLVKRFTGKSLPATGTSIGVDRLFAALSHLGLIDKSRQTVTEVMILRLEKDRDNQYLEIASQIRRKGINTEISMVEDTSFKGQFNYAISRGVKFIVICGALEFEKETVQVKNLETRQQQEIPMVDLETYFIKP
jgi:histidyl-tRNA synthetase